MAEKKKETKTGKELEKKIAELKIELLKNTTKRKNIKKEIARALTQKRLQELKTSGGSD